MKILFFKVKASLKKWSTWVVIASIAFLLSVLCGIKIPENTFVVGIVSNGTEIGNVIIGQTDSAFVFKAYESKEEMSEDVSTGLIECGFVFDESFEERLEKNDKEKAVEYIYSPYTLKGQVAKETVFRYVYEYENSFILSEGLDAVYGDTIDKADKDIIMGKLLGKTGLYLDGNSTFTVDFRNDMK